jgi:hypothetical protein
MGWKSVGRYRPTSGCDLSNDKNFEISNTPTYPHFGL